MAKICRPEALVGKYVRLREVTVDDAEFILDLRTSEKGRILHKTENNLQKQIDYLKRYLTLDNEWYFIAENHSGERLGCIGIYDVREDSVVTGRWIMKDMKDYRPSVETKLLVNDYVFNVLGFANIRTDTRHSNKPQINMAKIWGCTEIGRDEEEVYFNLTREQYEKNRARVARFCI